MIKLTNSLLLIRWNLPTVYGGCPVTPMTVLQTLVLLNDNIFLEISNKPCCQKQNWSNNQANYLSTQT